MSHRTKAEIGQWVTDGYRNWIQITDELTLCFKKLHNYSIWRHKTHYDNHYYRLK